MYRNKSNDIQLTKIVSPSLNDVGYAKGLNGVFDNIDNNFNVLANRDFVKGESGDSINTRIVYFVDENGELNEYGKKLIQCIESSSTPEERKSLYDKYSNEISVWDVFNKNPGHLFMTFGVNKDVINSVETPLNSFYYIFLDGRYTTDKLQSLDADLYSDIKDLSCIVMYDNTVDGFKIVSNVFPTMYFDPSIGLCWQINGVKTGLAIQGVPGKPGLNSPVTIVKCDELESNDNILFGKISAIFDSTNGYNPINDNSIQEYETLINSTCLIITTDINTNGNNFYFGTIRELNNKLFCFCSQNTAINNSIRAEDFNNVLKNITTRKTNDIHSSLKGLFVPASNENKNAQSVHLLSSLASSKKIYENNSNRNDVIISPITDINAFNTDDNSVNVDKYLYIRVNKDSELFNRKSTNTDIKTTLYSDYGIKRYDYILKYKFTDKIINLNVKYDDTSIINPNFNILDDNNGSRYFTKSGIGEEFIYISDNNVAYNSTTYNNLLSFEHIDSMPKEFLQRFEDLTGVYRWELCDIKHEWDLPNMLNNEPESKYQYNDLGMPNMEELKNVFNVIFTTTLSPDSNTDFMWFNAICLDMTNNEEGFSQEYYRYIIPGWNYKLFPDVLKFVKFITIHNNEYVAKTDNTLNIDYDVNILGNNFYSKRNLNVSGIVGCNNLHSSNSIMINNGTHEFGFDFNNENVPILKYKKFDSDVKEMPIEQIFNLIKDIELIKEKLNLNESEEEN